MGMESVYKLSVFLNMVDKLSGPMNVASNNATSSIEKINTAFGTMQKAGVALAGTGGAIVGVGMKLVTSTFDTQNALGELSSLGVKDLKAIEDAAKSFSDTWAGTSKADFITASYDIKSGIASLTDEGVAKFTELAALTGKATKSTTEEMGSLFATGYGIYKGFYDDMSDLEFGEMFSAGIATAVKNYKTSGSEMASAISALGATATNANVPLEEQLAIIGQLQTTMSGSEAATKYKSFLNQASSAGEKLGLTFLDTNNNLRSMPEILTELKGKYGDTIDAVEKRQLKEAFGTDEAVALIDLLYNNVETLNGGIQDLQGSMKSGISITEEMANAINNTPEQKFQVLKQQIHNNAEELGKNLLPTVNETMDKVNGLIQKGSDWIQNNQETVKSITDIATKLALFLIIAGSFISLTGTAGKTVMNVCKAIGMAQKAMGLFNATLLANPVTLVVTAIAALAAIFVVLWNKSESFRGFWIGLFDQVKSSVLQAWTTIQPSLQLLGQKLMELKVAAQPIIDIVLKVGEAFLVVFGSYIFGCIQGTISALNPLIAAITSIVSFTTNVVNAIVALFRGDFSGAIDYTAAAVWDLKDFFLNGFDAILSYLGGFVSGFLDAIGSALSAAGFDVTEKISEMKNSVQSGLDETKQIFGNVLSAAAVTVQQKLNNIKNKYNQHGGGVKGIAAAYMEGIKGYYSSGYTFIDNLTGGKLSAIKNTFTSKMSEVKQQVSQSLDHIKASFSEKLESAHQTVTNVIAKMKAAFKFEWKLPDLKVPTVIVTGGVAPYGIAGKGSLPKFDVKWNRLGGIMTGPTIFGALGGKLMGGGEAGHEAILPLSELWKQMTGIVKNIIRGENKEERDETRRAGSLITSALSSKSKSFRTEREKISETKKEITTERSGKESGGTYIHSMQFTVDITKIKDLPLLFKLIDEIKDAQNGTDDPAMA